MLILSRFQYNNPLDSLQPVANKDDIIKLQKLTREVRVADAIRDYITSLVSMTRDHPDLTLGASPRGSLFLCEHPKPMPCWMVETMSSQTMFKRW